MIEFREPRRLRDIHVLLAGQDADFLRAGASALDREGFVVEATETLGDVMQHVRDGRCDVVVLDGSASVTRVARLLGALEAVGRPTGVVVVSDNPLAPRLDSFRPIPKWGSAERLITQVERAYAGSGSRGEACLAVL
jgi:DNA-binding NtrC family response regulator